MRPTHATNCGGDMCAQTRLCVNKGAFSNNLRLKGACKPAPKIVSGIGENGTKNSDLGLCVGLRFRSMASRRARRRI